MHFSCAKLAFACAGPRRGYTISMMTSERPTAKQILDQFYLEMRWRCLSLAADFDRVERAAGGRALLEGDPRIAKLREAVGLLLESGGANRAEKLQMIFSDKTPLK